MPAHTGAPSRAHTWIAVAALLWNLIGLLMFVLRVTIGPAQVAALSPADRSVYDATPGWLLLVFGVAVVTGVAGSIGLLMRQGWAITAFAVSLAAVVVQMLATYAVTPAWQAYGVAGVAMPLVLVVIAVLLVRYAQRAT